MSGLTYRIGRYIEGNIYLIEDLVHEILPNTETGKGPKSICLVGAPGRGKTSVLR